MSFFNKFKKQVAIAMFLLMTALSVGMVAPQFSLVGTAVAGSADASKTFSDGTTPTDDYEEFDDVWDRIAAWTTGSLGRVVAIAFVVIGIVAGAARQSIMAFAIGIAAALGLVYASQIIKSVFDGDVNATADVLNGALEQMNNHAQMLK